MPKILVLGLGNPDRGDDGIGAQVADRLARMLPEGVDLRTRRGDMLGLLDDWAGFDAVICIDAAAPDGKPGRVHRIDLHTEDLSAQLRYASSHGFGIADAIALARTLGIAPPVIIVYAIEGGSFAAGSPMTAEVSCSAAEVSSEVLADCRRMQGLG